jgi:hypothetical protein
MKKYHMQYISAVLPISTNSILIDYARQMEEWKNQSSSNLVLMEQPGIFEQKYPEH